MRYLNVLVLVEGNTDVDFLEPVLTRALENLVLHHVEPEVLVACEVEVAPAQAPREEKIADRAQRGAFELVALHVDGTADTERERSKYFVPVQHAWRTRELKAHLIPIVPVREMEAWALCDRDELWQVAGREIPERDIFEGNRLSAPESLSDPKQTLADVMRRSRKHRSTRADPRSYLPILGERMPLTSLQALPSYQAFEQSFVEVLTEMGWTR